MEERGNILKRILKNKVARKSFIISVLAVVAVVFVYIFLYNKEEKITPSYLGTKLTKVGELTTVKLNYTGFLEYHDKGIPLFNKSDFLMTYEANARVGIDLEEVEIEVDNPNKLVTLSIPKAEILDVKIDPNKIKYYDTKFALFNVNEKEDGNKAQALAEEQAYKDLTEMGVLESANEQALTLIKGLYLRINCMYQDRQSADGKTAQDARI